MNSMRFCPHSGCPGYLRARKVGPKAGRIVQKGFYRRKEDAHSIQRYRCLDCGRSFSSARLSPCYRQKKRKVNSKVMELLSSSVSQRRIAKLLRLNRKTVVRKFLFLGALAQDEHKKFLAEMFQSGRSGQNGKIQGFYFDEMESFERSKCLPLSIPLVVLPESRKILGFRVASMPAKGPLAEISRKKYGPREDHREKMALDLFSELAPLVRPGVEILSDQNPKYPGWLKVHFPKARHRTFKGRRGCVVGQGELKKIGFDPLFDLNHTCAMFRANVNRLVRRTWCTTRRPERLALHLALYAWFHNQQLTQSS